MTTESTAQDKAAGLLRPTGRFGPFSSARFTVFWAGRLFSRLGTAMSPVALTLAIVTGGGSGTDLGIVLGVAGLSEVALILPGGVWADRFPKNVVMVVADVMRSVTQVFVGLELLNGKLDITHLAIAGAFMGAGNALFMPAVTGIVPAIVEPTQLQQANALLGVARRGAMVLGPMLATTLVLTLGAGSVLVIDAGTYALSAIGLLFLRGLRRKSEQRERFRTELVEGWRELRRHRWYWTNLITHSIWNLGKCFFLTLGPLIVIDSAGGELSWGMVVEVSAIGALVGTLVSIRLRSRRPMVPANLFLSLGALPLAMLAVDANPLLVAVASALSYFGLGVLGTLWDTAIQEHVPEQMISRVSAYDWLTSSALNPLGLALAGPIAVIAGTTTTLAVAAVLVAASALGVLLVPDVRNLSARPAAS